MNKLQQFLFLVLFPFYPFWAMLSYYFTHRYVNIFTELIFIPFAIYIVIFKKIRFPVYLIFLFLFTIFHLFSFFINDLGKGQSIPFILLSDLNILACTVLFVAENTDFEDILISLMTRLILVVVAISLVVSLIQVKNPYFLVSPDITNNLGGILYLEQHRDFSIYSWVNINSVGITFPILISILLSFSKQIKNSLPFTIITGMAVAFLTRARYTMISTLIVLSQMFFNAKIEFKRKFYISLIFTCSIIFLAVIANVYGYDIQQVVSDRILEKRTGLSSFNARVTSYEVFKLVFPEHPLFGVGPETRADVVQLLGGVAPLIHIGYLSYLYFYGIFGSLLIFCALFFLLRDGWLIGRRHNYWGSFYGLIAFCFANFTFVYFNFSEAGVVLAIVYLVYFKNKQAEGGPCKPVPIKIQDKA